MRNIPVTMQLFILLVNTYVTFALLPSANVTGKCASRIGEIVPFVYQEPQRKN